MRQNRRSRLQKINPERQRARDRPGSHPRRISLARRRLMERKKSGQRTHEVCRLQCCVAHNRWGLTPFFSFHAGNSVDCSLCDGLTPFIEPHTPHHLEMSKSLPAVYHITESYIDHFRPSTGAFPCRCR